MQIGGTSLEISMIRAGTSEVLRNPKVDSIVLEDRIQREKEITLNLAKTIDSSLKDPANPFNILITAFREIFSSYFTENILEYQADLYEEYKENFDKSKLESSFVPKPLKQKCKKTQEAFYSLQRFIKLLLDCLAEMYSVSLDYARLNALREPLTNSLIETIIDKQVYTVTFMFLRMENQAEESRIEQHICKLASVRPEQLNISPYFCLNECSWNEKVLSSIKSNAENDDWEEVLKRKIKENVQPYEEAIKKLKESTLFGAPVSKLKTITTLNPTICRCIDSFWQGIPVNKEKLFIDADQYLTILVYIVIKADAKDLFTHISLANEFATLGSTSSYNAYCLTTLQASFYHLMNLNADDLLKQNH
eukprot:TRINITY_DN4330_c0_g4_i1.p1 TRINITY_DN4330_c0_g4~~TRINITY_DN4330_c0_g4_i1.p1  ORF type:complete len:364 (-),score=97.08 TRINITY_DN4330_c0_g4_i1:66-1157(-)